MELTELHQKVQRHMQNRDALAALELTGYKEELLEGTDVNKAFLAAEIYFAANGYHEAAELYHFCWKHAPHNPALKTKLIESYTQIYYWDQAIQVFFTNETPATELPRQIHFVILSILSSGQHEYFPDIYNIIRANIAQYLSNPYLQQLLHLTGATESILPILKQYGPNVKAPIQIAVITNILQEHFNNQPGSYLLENLYNFFNQRINKTWLHYQLLRDYPAQDFPALQEEEPSLPIEEAAFDYMANPRISSILHPPKIDFQIPKINPDIFKEGLLNFRNLIKTMIAQGEFQTQINNIRYYLEDAPTKCKKPIFVLSSGRSGTTAIHHLFQELPETFSYHSYQWQMSVLEANHTLYRMLLNNFTDESDLAAFKELLIRFVKARCIELIYAIRKGQRPVLTGHWDTIFTPIWAEIFPESQFIHLHRNHQSVFKSIYIKNQWLNNQLQPYKYDPNFTDGIFHVSHIEDLGVTEKISWFLHVTECFANTFFETLPERCLNVKSEDLFTCNQETFQTLVNFLNIPSLNIEKLAAHYATPVNEKTDKPIFRKDLDIQTKKLLAYHQQLKETGRLTTI